MRVEAGWTFQALHESQRLIAYAISRRKAEPKDVRSLESLFSFTPYVPLLTNEKRGNMKKWNRRRKARYFVLKRRDG